MSLWRLEILRMIRTRRWLALVAVYVLFGFLGPVGARYLEQLLSMAGGELEGATIDLPDPTPADGMAQYVSNAVQVGTLVTVVVAAGALAFDATPEMGVFLRTRTRSTWQLLRPRLTVSFAATATAYVAGALCAWYETWALLGAPDTTGSILGIVLGVVFLAFVVSLVGAVAQWVASVLSAVMVTLVTLVALPLVGIIGPIGRWSPSRLATALADLNAEATAGDYLEPTLTTAAAIVLLVLVAIAGANRREL